MRFSPLPHSHIPYWAALNNVKILDTKINTCYLEELIPEKGFIATKTLSSVDTVDKTILLDVPKDLVLGKEFLSKMERIDPHFNQLRDLVGRKSYRVDMLLFLLLQMTIARNESLVCTYCYERKIICEGFELSESGKCKTCEGLSQECQLATVELRSEGIINVGVKNPWSGYIRFLPAEVPTVTMWNDEERKLLVGTSLEIPVAAKLSALSREFEELRMKTTEIPWCYSNWWERSEPLLSLQLSDWVRVDAWYRSRSLELPNVGAVMVPCLDMANHSPTPEAYFEQSSNGNVLLVLRPDVELCQGNEITISYGEGKSDAEYLFAYGFIDDRCPDLSLDLTLEPMEGDPLGMAKVAAFKKRPFLRIAGREGDSQIIWEAPFLYLTCLNEEDGLEFKTWPELDGSNSLRVFWQETEVTESIEDFETLIKGHRLEDLFRLRAVTLLRQRIDQQLQRLDENQKIILDDDLIDSHNRQRAWALRERERDLLNTALKAAREEEQILIRRVLLFNEDNDAEPDDEDDSNSSSETTHVDDFS